MESSSAVYENKTVKSELDMEVNSTQREIRITEIGNEIRIHEKAIAQLNEELNFLLSLEFIKIEKEEAAAPTPPPLSPIDCQEESQKRIKMNSIKRNIAGSYICKICDKKFDIYKRFWDHQLTHNKRHICEECGKKFATRTCLRVHYSTHTGEKRFSCSVCGKSFRQQAHHKTHMLIHTGVRNFCCEICGKEFLRKNDLSYHACSRSEGNIKRRQSRRPIKCDICDKILSNKHNLKKHTLLHAGQRNFACSQCSKSFFSETVLKRHILVRHSDEKNFVCSVCGKGFPLESSLQHHLVMHGERTFKCEQCGKTFRQKGHLHSHKILHTGIKQFVCQTCGHAFYLKSNLKQHEKIHTTNNK